MTVGPNVGVSWDPAASQVATFLASGSFTPSVSGLYRAKGCGGGGQGGGGARNAKASPTFPGGGGGGGGGAQEHDEWFYAVAGEEWTVVIGAGGSAAGGGATADDSSGVSGSAGTDTTLTNGSVTYTWPGAGGGEQGRASASTPLVANPGRSHRLILPLRGNIGTNSNQYAELVYDIGSGGRGGQTGATTQQDGDAGQPAWNHSAVASGGTQGDDDTGCGGSGGGAGGSGGGGAGGTGGTGGKGSATTGAAGSAGADAAANTGAGGGGGGGGGNGATASGNGGNGAKGGSGYMRIYGPL